MNLPILNRKIEIIREYDICQGKVKIGLDKVGNLYAKCNSCKVNIPVLLNVDKKAKIQGKIRKVAKCHKCGFLAYL